MTEMKIGTIISGTTRPQDLIPVFVEELRRLEGGKLPDEVESDYLEWRTARENEKADAALNEHSRAFLKDMRMRIKGREFSVQLDEGFLLSALFEHLNRHAPPGCYFGSHPGDGADYGFWPNEDEEDEEAPSHTHLLADATVKEFDVCLAVLRKFNITAEELSAYADAQEFIIQAKESECDIWNYLDMARAAELEDPRDRIIDEFEDIFAMVTFITGDKPEAKGD